MKKTIIALFVTALSSIAFSAVNISDLGMVKKFAITLRADLRNLEGAKLLDLNCDSYYDGIGCSSDVLFNGKHCSENYVSRGGKTYSVKSSSCSFRK